MNSASGARSSACRIVLRLVETHECLALGRALQRWMCVPLRQHHVASIVAKQTLSPTPSAASWDTPPTGEFSLPEKKCAVVRQGHRNVATIDWKRINAADSSRWGPHSTNVRPQRTTPCAEPAPRTSSAPAPKGPPARPGAGEMARLQGRFLNKKSQAIIDASSRLRAASSRAAFLRKPPEHPQAQSLPPQPPPLVTSPPAALSSSSSCLLPAPSSSLARWQQLEADTRRLFELQRQAGEESSEDSGDDGCLSAHEQMSSLAAPPRPNNKCARLSPDSVMRLSTTGTAAQMLRQVRRCSLAGPPCSLRAQFNILILPSPPPLLNKIYSRPSRLEKPHSQILR